MGGNGLFTRQRRFFNDCQQTFSWYIPDGVTKVFAFVIGGGGGGSYAGHGNQYDRQGAAGGAGGGYASGVISGLTPGNTITVTVGKPGRGATHDQASTAGTASSFGSYLTGNGGTNGVTWNTPYSTEANAADAWGTGGSASTSGVSEAYTAAGGGITPRQNDSRLSYYATCAGGGASSGSPFGKGNNRPHFCRQAATGGSGWGTGNMKDAPWYAHIQNTSSQQRFAALGGDGSHVMSGISMSKETTQGRNAMKGGNGMQALGGAVGRVFSHDSTVYPNYKERCGENANPNWWFPWEIDGGGGGGIVMAGISTNNQDNYQQQLVAGNGAPGGGGGGAFFNREDFNMGMMVQGGDGGFGGGGGAVYNWNQSANAQQVSVSRAGNGGIGGGGGSVSGHYTQDSQTWYSARGGDGGKGIVAVYW